MKKNNIVEIIVVILIGVAVIYIISNQLKTVEKFTTINEKELTADNLTELMKKQYNLLKYLENIDTSTQKSKYLPHLDVINSYKNKSITFLDSLKKNVSNHIKKKENHLSRLDNTVLRLSQYKQDNIMKDLYNTDFKTIKSHNNGMNLSVNRLGYDNYQVKVNDGCLRVSPENDYSVVPCDVNDIGQHFKFNHIFNEVEYRNNMSKAFPQLSKLSNVHYPLTMVKSKVTDNCLKNSNGKLSVEPCREYEGQRWASSKTEHKCQKLF